jgi:tetratricopeptide (TPR) repeat protein
MSAFSYQGTGRYEKSIDEAGIAIGLDPGVTNPYFSRAFAYLYLDRLKEAEVAIQQLSGRKLEIPDLVILRYHLAFLKGDQRGMDREAAGATGKSGTEDWMMHLQALASARSGQLQLARRRSRRAVDLARQAGERERAAIFATGAAVWEGFFGNAPEARRSAMAALELSKGRDVEYGAAFALALAAMLLGRSTRGRSGRRFLRIRPCDLVCPRSGRRVRPQ